MDRFKSGNNWWYVEFDTPSNAFFRFDKPKNIEKVFALPFEFSDELIEDDMHNSEMAGCNASPSYPPPGRQTDEQFALQQEFEVALTNAQRVSNLYGTLNNFYYTYQGCKSSLTPSQKREFRKLVEKMLNT